MSAQIGTGNPASTADQAIPVESPVVACDGGGGALGHPRVYLNMGNRQDIDCPYCGRHYVLKAGAGHRGH